MGARIDGTRIDPNEFLQVRPLATKMLQEGSAIHVDFQALDLIPAFSDEQHGVLGLAILADAPGQMR
jgi:hypothetical protein